MKLTELQIEHLTPLIGAKNKAELNLVKSIELLVGRKFKSMSIRDGILSIEELEQAKPVEKFQDGEIVKQ